MPKNQNMRMNRVNRPENEVRMELAALNQSKNFGLLAYSPFALEKINISFKVA
jgi:hypothetical protein